jgi:hypothetical protein
VVGFIFGTFQTHTTMKDYFLKKPLSCFFGALSVAFFFVAFYWAKSPMPPVVSPEIMAKAKVHR